MTRCYVFQRRHGKRNYKTRNLAIANRSSSASHNNPVEFNSRNNCSHANMFDCCDSLRTLYMRYFFETQTMKLFTVTEMTFNGHSRSLAMAQFNKPHISLLHEWSVVTILCLSFIVSENSMSNKGVFLKSGLTVVQSLSNFKFHNVSSQYRSKRQPFSQRTSQQKKMMLSTATVLNTNTLMLLLFCRPRISSTYFSSLC